MASLQNTLKPQLDLLAERGRKQRLAVARRTAVSRAVPVTMISLPVVPLLAAILTFSGCSLSVLWTLLAMLLITGLAFAVRFATLMRGQQFSRAGCLALFDNVVASGERIRTADEFLSSPNVSGFQLAAINDAEAAVKQALNYTFSPLRYTFPAINAVHKTSALAACFLLVLMPFIPGPKTYFASGSDEQRSVVAMADNTGINESERTDAETGNGADSDDQQNSVPEASSTADNDVTSPAAEGKNPASDGAKYAEPAEPADASSSADSSHRPASGRAGDEPSDKSDAATEQAARSQPIPHRATPEQAQDDGAPSQTDAASAEGAGESAASPATEGEQNAVADKQSRDSSSSANPATESESSKAGSTPVTAAAKGGKPPAEARKGQQQQQQQNQSGNQSNRNSQNSGNQAGDDGQKQARGIGGLMLSVPMADQFTGTQGPGPKQQKIKPDLMPAPSADDNVSENRGSARGDTGQRPHLFSDSRDRQLLQSFYQRSRQTKTVAPTTEPSTDNNNQQGQ